MAKIGAGAYVSGALGSMLGVANYINTYSGIAYTAAMAGSAVATGGSWLAAGGLGAMAYGAIKKAIAKNELKKEERRKIASKEEEKKYFNALQTYFSTRKQELMDDAIENDRYDLDFMEYVQNKEVLKSGGKKLQKVYEQYLDNPEKFIFVDLDKLPDQK